MAEETEDGHSLLQEVSRIELDGGIPLVIIYLDKDENANLTSMSSFCMRITSARQLIGLLESYKHDLMQSEFENRNRGI